MHGKCGKQKKGRETTLTTRLRHRVTQKSSSNIPPKDVSFSDFICIFAMPDEVLFDYYSNTKLSEFSDMAKSLATFCCSGFYKRENLQCCGIKVNLTNTIGELLNN